MNHAIQSSALVVEGGGMRAAFSTGIVDAFLTEQFNPFHLYVGVSSGSTTLANYLAQQKGRNLDIFWIRPYAPNSFSSNAFSKVVT
jgi:predicted patatin/cPLA2 family phospholipase